MDSILESLVISQLNLPENPTGHRTFQKSLPSMLYSFYTKYSSTVFLDMCMSSATQMNFGVSPPLTLQAMLQ